MRDTADKRPSGVLFALPIEGVLLDGGGSIDDVLFLSGGPGGGARLERTGPGGGGAATLGRAGGGGGAVEGAASDTVRARKGGAASPVPIGGLRAGGGGTALPGEADPALVGLGGGGGGALPGVVRACLLCALAGWRLFRGGTAGTGLGWTAGTGRGGDTLREGIAGGGRGPGAGGLELLRVGGALRGGGGAPLLGGGGALGRGGGADRDGRLGAGRAGAGEAGLGGGICLLRGGGAGDAGFGGGADLLGIEGADASRLGIKGGFARAGGFASPYKSNYIQDQGDSSYTKIVLSGRLQLWHTSCKETCKLRRTPSARSRNRRRR